MAGAKIFVACAPGLEAVTAQEMRSLGFLPMNLAAPLLPGRDTAGDFEAAGGGVELIVGSAPGSSTDMHSLLESVYRLNLCLRTASRVLVRLGEFYAAAFSELRKKAGRLEWERYLTSGRAVALRVTCHKSRLYHSDAVAERVLGAIADRLGKPLTSVRYDETAHQDLPQLVVVRLLHDQVTVSIDSSGEHLHRRGYRLAAAKAPLRETLAAGVLLASGWDQVSPLLDPFCGSGTIPIEAALLAIDLAPGRSRRFAFMEWPGFDPEKFDHLLKGLHQPAGDPHSDGNRQALVMRQAGTASGFVTGDRDKPPAILGSDRDAGAIAMSQANASRAGVAGSIGFSCQAVSAIEPPTGRGWVVTNPPYGLRVSANKDLRNLYAQLGSVLRLKCPGWRFAILCSDERLFSHTGLRSITPLSFENGGVQVKLYCGTVPD